MQELTGRTAFVTGAASGIGLALTEAFVARGMSVVMADVEEPALVAAASRLEGAGASVTGVLCDVTDPSAVERARDEALAAYGAVHVVCNNAGVAPAGPMLGTTAAEWRWVVDVNVLGVAHGVTTFAPLLVEQGEGHIVNTASEAGLSTTPALGMYCASKHAVVGLSEALFHELVDSPVGVSCLCPELVDTGIFESERNSPEGIEFGTGHGATMPFLRETIHSSGISPSVVADTVVDAVLADRFWVFTHDHTLPRARSRFEDLEAGRNPTSPYDNG